MIKMAVVLLAVLAPLQLLIGDQHGLNTLKHQPIKIAAMEAHWESDKPVDFHIFAWPDETAETNHWALSIPNAGSLDPHAPAQRPHHRAEGRGAAEPSAGEDRVLRLPHHARDRLLHDRGGADRGLAALARHAVRDALVPAHRRAGLVDRLRRGDRRLGGDRERPPALGRAGHAADRRRDLAAGGIDGAHDADSVRDRLCHRICHGHLLYQPTDRAWAAGPRGRAAGARLAARPLSSAHDAGREALAPGS